MRYSILLLFLITYNGFSQSKDCLKFKTGNFKYTNPDFQHFTITRNDTMQIEIDKNRDVTVKASIKWLSDCEYLLTYKEVINSSVQQIIGTKVKVQIIESNNNTYLCRAVSDDNLMDSKIEMIKVE